MSSENKEKHFPVKTEPIVQEKSKKRAWKYSNEKRNRQLQPDSLQTNKTACWNKKPYYNTYNIGLMLTNIMFM